jgi:triphosphoribosyl-dephospho-CoA synthase
MRSLFALRSYFVRITGLGAEGASFDALQRCGLDAEARMLEATGGINTHRGAIFMLGLLCASAGAVTACGGRPTPALLRETLRARWGDALAARAHREPTLPGGLAARRYGLRSASQEAAAGFPVLFETAVPAMQSAIACGLSRQQVRLDTLFTIIAVLDDCNLAHRGGMEGLRYAQRAANGFLASGGAAQPDATAAARKIGAEFVRRRLSPGGAADTLAAACWMRRLGSFAAR